MRYMLRNIAKVYLLALALLLPGFANAEIVRVELTVESIIQDSNGTGLQVGDTLGYVEYDNTGLVRWDEATPWGDPALTSVTYLTDFSLDFAGNHYGLEDLSFTQVFLDDEYLYENPFIFLGIETDDFGMNWLGYHPELYLFEGVGSGYFAMDISATAVPIPAAAYLFASGLGLLGWFRRRQSA